MNEIGKSGINNPGSSSKIEQIMSQDLSKEAGKKSHCLFLSGFNGTYAGIRGIKEGLELQYGIGNVREFNSVISPDPQNPNRFNEIADVIQQRAEGGLDIVAHSLGAAELSRALKIIEKRDEEFLNKKENTENLHIVLIAPAGFSKGIKNVFRYMGRTLKFLYEQGDLPISKSNTLLRGMDALTAFPPNGVSSRELSLALRKAMPELSQYEEEAKKIPLEKGEGYMSSLPPDKKNMAEIYGEMIRQAAVSGNYEGLRHLVTRYGSLLRQPLTQVFAGNFEPTNAPVAEAVRSTVGGYLGLLTTLVEAYSSKPMKELEKLKDKGVRIDLMIPEYDAFMRLSEALKFFDGTSNGADHVLLAEAVPHAYIALRKYNFAKTIKESGVK